MAMPDVPSDVITNTFSSWLQDFTSAIASADPARIADLFIEDSYWKDLLAFSWEFRLFSGRANIEAGLKALLPAVKPHSVRYGAGRSAPRLLKRLGKPVIEGFFDFDTQVGRCTGFARLMFDPGNPLSSRAWIVLTTLQELHGFEETIGSRRPSGHEYSRNFGGDNWLDKRIKEQTYADRDPQVLIIGAGQSGLAVAARMRQIGVDALIVEKDPRVGDNWRNRYHSLTLHNEVWANSLPYLPFPPNWPVFVPKDKLAGWLEAYAEFMELNVWTATKFIGAKYNPKTGIWDAVVQRAGASERTLRVRHIVLATGSINGIPNIPAFPGMDKFQGEMMHSSRFSGGRPYAGKRAVVVGTGNSAHDVAQDLHSNGAAEVTIVQRNPTAVVSLKPSGILVYALYSEPIPLDDIDLIFAAVPYDVIKQTYVWLTKRTCSLDRELLDRLNAAGFETDFEPDGTGFHMKYMRRGGGYYINVGCADLIADHKVGLVQARDIERLENHDLVMKDGKRIGADLLVMATGYQNLQVWIRQFFGDEVAERVGPVWGFDEQYFMRNMWKQTAQPGLWIMGGGLNECRFYSRYVALQIKASLEGLMPVQSGSEKIKVSAGL